MDKYFKDKAPIASRWEIMLAKIFGKKYVGYDGENTVLVSEWRGKKYILDIQPRP